MARMTMRSREAPMDWEREQDRNVPNIFSSPQPLDTNDSPGAISSFGSFSSERSQLSKEFSFTSQKDEGSSTSGNREFSFSQDSKVLPSSKITTTGFGKTKQGSFSFGQEVPRTRSQSPSINGSGASNTKQLSPLTLHDQGVINAAPIDTHSIDSNSAFNMGSMRSEVFDHDNSKQQSRQRSRQHSPSGWGYSASSIRSGSNLHLRNTKPEHTHSSDDDGVGSDENTYSSEEEELASRRHNKSKRSGQDRSMELRGYKEQRSLHREASYSRSKSQSKSQGRIWSENVDLPFILSGYVQVLMNTASVLIFIYIIANFITTIQNDVSLRMEGELRRVAIEIQECEVEYFKSCNREVGSMLISACERLKACMSQPSPSIARATIAAETFAHIANSFVNTISYKTMGFVLVIVLGGLYMSNQAISNYRSNHIMHHQHSIVPPPNQAGPIPLKQSSSFSNGAYPRTGNNPSRPWNSSSSLPSREGSFITGGPSQGLGVQRHRSLLEAPHSEDEFGN